MPVPDHPPATTLPDVGRPRPGRPRTSTDESRRLQAIEAAEGLFLTSGFAASTMTDIARRAGMSKKTIYTVFESKEALLAAVLERRFQPLIVPLVEDDPRPVEDTLTELLHRALSFIVDPPEVRFLRLLIGDDAQSSQVTAVMNRLGLFHERSTIGAWMTHQAASGAIEIEDPVAAAEMLIGMGLRDLHIRLLLGAVKQPSEEALAERAGLAVRMFLRGAQKHRPAPAVPPRSC